MHKLRIGVGTLSTLWVRWLSNPAAQMALEKLNSTGDGQIKADRKTGSMTILNVWPEPNVRWTPSREARLDAELRRLANFVGVDALVWETRSP